MNVHTVVLPRTVIRLLEAKRTGKDMRTHSTFTRKAGAVHYRTLPKRTYLAPVCSTASRLTSSTSRNNMRLMRKMRSERFFPIVASPGTGGRHSGVAFVGKTSPWAMNSRHGMSASTTLIQNITRKASASKTGCLHLTSLPEISNYTEEMNSCRLMLGAKASRS